MGLGYRRIVETQMLIQQFARFSVLIHVLLHLIPVSAVGSAGGLAAGLGEPAEAGAGAGAGQRAAGGQGGVRHPEQTPGAEAGAGFCSGLPQREHGTGLYTSVKPLQVLM